MYTIYLQQILKPTDKLCTEFMQISSLFPISYTLIAKDSFYLYYMPGDL